MYVENGKYCSFSLYFNFFFFVCKQVVIMWSFDATNNCMAFWAGKKREKRF